MISTVAVLGFFLLVAMLLARSWALGQWYLPKRHRRRLTRAVG